MERKPHWEKIYTTKAPTQVSWYQSDPAVSLDLIACTGVETTSHIIDVGGGASMLVDVLLARQFQNITVLDISSAAINHAQKRLGIHAKAVNWLEADITEVTLPQMSIDLWHDRAVFHFLTLASHRARYLQTLKQSLKPGGHFIVATFALDGPTHCSGLEVVRYSPQTLHEELGDSFDLIESRRERHPTPSGTEQKFIYCYFRKQ